MLGSFNFDQYFLWALTHHLRELYWFFYAVTMLGSPTAVTVLASLAFILGKNKLKVFAAILLIGLMFSFFIVDDLKDIVKRPRPPGINTTRYLVVNGYSFPSGHALTIFLAAAVLGAYYGWKYRLIGYAIASLVSISRVYLGVHYPTDVIAGALIGTMLDELLVYAAYRYGVCDNAGLVSLLRKPSYAEGADKTKIPYARKIPLMPSAVAFLTVILTLALYQYDNDIPAIIILSAAALAIILFSIRPGAAYYKKFLMAFAFISIGLIGSLILLSLRAYALSLLWITAAYIACLALTYERAAPNTPEKAGKIKS